MTGLTPGQIVLDRYVVEGRLAEGGMGEVWRARHERLGFPVALKILVGGDPSTLARFDREARLMARIRHPNVIVVLDCGGLPDGTPCIAMELIEGESLEARIRRRGPRPWPEAVAILLQSLAGLHAIHGASVLHRDLKPSNILIAAGPPEVVKLIDFGISRPTALDATRYTRTGLLIGTPAYLPPERLLDKPCDERSDLYAAGLILHEILTGQIPFGGNTIEAVLRRAMLPIPDPVAPPGLPALPEGLVAILRSVLAIDPAGRPPTARRFAELLHALRSGVRASAPAAATGVAKADQPVPDAARTVVDSVPAAAASSTTSERLLIVARLPPSRLADTEERRWLGGLAAPTGRSFTLGSLFWVALVPERAGSDEARRVREAIAARYRDLAKVQSTRVGATFALSAASLSGASPLPQELVELIESVQA